MIWRVGFRWASSCACTRTTATLRYSARRAGLAWCAIAGRHLYLGLTLAASHILSMRACVHDDMICGRTARVPYVHLYLGHQRVLQHVVQ
jgi:hypothetical protein